MPKDLIERTYLGVGYHHAFQNNLTQEVVFVETTQQAYEALRFANAGEIPSLEGHTWIGSVGGTYKVDSPTGLLGENEYCTVGDEKIVVLPKKSETDVQTQKVESTQFEEFKTELWL